MAKALKIKAKRNGYRRAGFRFSDDNETTIELAALKEEQIEQLKADKNLLVAEVETKAEKGGKPDDDKSGGGAGDGKPGGSKK